MQNQPQSTQENNSIEESLVYKSYSGSIMFRKEIVNITFDERGFSRG